MDVELENLVLEDNYYQLLNVHRTATNDEISSAYRRLSKMFHPDKHSTDPVRQKSAEAIFNKIKKAYEVLSDDHKRAIYDTLGEQGLKVNNMEVVIRSRTPKEIIEEYARLQREREEHRLQQSSNPRGTITMSINATDMFSKYTDEYEIIDDSLLPTIEVSSISIQQSIDTPVTLRDTVTLSGNISTQNGVGSGAVMVTNRRVTSERGWLESDLSIGNGPQIGLKMFRTLSKMIFLNCGTSLHFTARGMAPSFYSTAAMQLDSKSVGYLTFRATAGGSSLSTVYVTDSEKFYVNTAVQLGSPHSFISFNITYKMPDYEMKLKLSTKVGTFGALAEYGAEKKLSQTNSVSAAVSVGVPTGVMLRLKWTSSSQTIVVPIHLSEEVMPSPIFYATIVPIISWLAIKKLLIEPIVKERSEREKQKTMEANYEKLQEMQKEARAVVQLMKETYSRMTSNEEKCNGLIILKALYGKLPEDAQAHDVSTDAIFDPDEMDTHFLLQEVIDVTIPLQCLVKDSKLELLEASKSELPGFFDPSIGEKKHLTVRYLFNNNVYCKTVIDNEALFLPSLEHN